MKAPFVSEEKESLAHWQIERTQRRVRLMRAISLLGGLLSLGWAVATLFSALGKFNYVNILFTIIYLTCASRRDLLSRSWDIYILGTTYFVHITFLSVIVYGVEGKSHIWFVVIAAAALFVLDRHQRWLAAPTFLISTFLFIGVEYSLFPFEPLVVLPAESGWIPGALTQVLALIALTLIVYMYVIEIDGAEGRLAGAERRNVELLENTFPKTIIKRLHSGERTIADRYESATVLFADIVGFTPMASRVEPHELVQMLNDVFWHWDEHCQQLGLEKIKTIGDAYMLAAGIPVQRDDHAKVAAEQALFMINSLVEVSGIQKHNLQIRIGLHSGSVVAGIIGKTKFAYDLWGPTVNTAARMESHGEAGRVHMSNETRILLGDNCQCTDRGNISVKGVGDIHTWWLDGLSASN